LLANATLSSFATNAGFVNSHGLAIDSSNNIYTGSTTTIYKITPAGTISTFKSGFICAWGLAFDTSGNLYVADEGANAVYKITSNSTQTTFSTSSLLNGPAGLVFDLNGNLYVSNWGGFAGTTIIKLNSTGTTATTYSTGNIGPQDMIFQANGSMLVAENGASGGASGYIGLVPTGGGSPTSVLATGTGTQGIANDANGNLWVTGWLGQQLMKYSPTFSLLETLSTTTYGTTLINDPESIRTDSIGNLYFVNWGSTTLTKIVP
jgi:sugar lactone lactonase YvrE